MLSTYTKNLSARQMLQSINSTETVEELCRFGLESSNDRVALAAMEELFRRGDYAPVMTALLDTVDEGQLKLGTTMTQNLANALKDERELPAEFRAVGKYGARWNGQGGLSPNERGDQEKRADPSESDGQTEPAAPVQNWVQTAVADYYARSNWNGSREDIIARLEQASGKNDELVEESCLIPSGNLGGTATFLRSIAALEKGDFETLRADTAFMNRFGKYLNLEAAEATGT